MNQTDSQSGTITIPGKAKPSKACSTDKTRPILLNGHLRKTDTGWQIEATDSYMAARIPVDVAGDVEEGPLPVKALKDVEGTNLRQFGARNSSLTLDGERVTYAREMPLGAEVSAFPNVNQLWPEPAEKTITVGINAKLLLKLAEAIGASESTVCLTLDPAKVISDGQYVSPLVVTPMLNKNSAAEGLIMPVKSYY